MRRFELRATVSTERPEAVRPILESLVPGGRVTPSEDPKEFRVEGTLTGVSARDLNRQFLAALRRGERRTRLRSEWSSPEGVERFFDYVPKGKRAAVQEPPS